MKEFLEKNAINLASLFFLIPTIILFASKGTLVKNLALDSQKKEIKYVKELNSPEAVAEIFKSTGKFDEKAKTATWEGKPAPLPPKELSFLVGEERGAVLGAPGEEKWIEVDLDKQRLYAREGDKLVYEFKVSTGKSWTPTVTGDYRIYLKVRAQLMTGGEGSDYYYLPNVPFVQYFYKGYSLHGTYWHNDFGKPRSHGCVNLSIPDSEVLFWWTNPPLAPGQGTISANKDNPGTRIVIHGKTPPYN